MKLLRPYFKRNNYVFLCLEGFVSWGLANPQFLAFNFALDPQIEDNVRLVLKAYIGGLTWL